MHARKTEQRHAETARAFEPAKRDCKNNAGVPARTPVPMSRLQIMSKTGGKYRL